MKLHAKITNENGAIVSKGGNRCLQIEFTHQNRMVGKIAFEIWGYDTLEPFYALMWYPKGYSGEGYSLHTKGETKQGKTEECPQCKDGLAKGHECFHCGRTGKKQLSEEEWEYLNGQTSPDDVFKETKGKTPQSECNHKWVAIDENESGTDSYVCLKCKSRD